MKAPLGRGTAKHRDALVGKHMVGNALVLHTEDQISGEAQTLALTVPEDDENDIVLLDLHGDMPVGIWEAVAHALRRRRRGIRLVVCGQQTETIVLAGQWLSERVNRTVIAPYGYVIRGAAGALFVHAGENSGWVRFRPGKTPIWDAKRFPEPLWDSAATEFMPTSAAGVAEPLPGGVWIRDTRDIDLIREHWQWLVTSLPCQPHALAVVLGCPGTPPLPLDDIARFWRELDEDNRRRVRFVHYGPVQTLPGEALGQVLADLLSSQVICFGGIPLGDPARPQMHTVTASGELGWQVFARELSYTPRLRVNSPPTTPHMLSHRAPLVLGEPLAPMVYWYANDAVIEVVQSGLWMRPMEAPRNAASVRAAKPSAEHHTFIFDDANAARAGRMRALAEDVIARLDPATRQRSALVAASMVSTGSGPAQAGGQVAIEGQYFSGVDERITAEDWETGHFPQLAPAPTAAGAGFAADGPVHTEIPVALETAPSDDDATALNWSQSGFLAQAGQEPPPPPTVSDLMPRLDQVGVPVEQSYRAPAEDQDTPRHAAQEYAVPSLSVLEPAAPPATVVEMTLSAAAPIIERPPAEQEQVSGVGLVHPVLTPVEPPRAPAGYSPSTMPAAPAAPSVLPAAPTASSVLPAEPSALPAAPIGPGSLPAAPSVPPGPPTASGAVVAAPIGPGPLPIASGALPAGVFAPGGPSRSVLAPTVDGELPQRERKLPPPPTKPIIPAVEATAPSVTPTPLTPVTPSTAEISEGPEAPVAGETPRFQPIPEASASALLSGRGMDEERAWLRRTLSREFDGVASSISRVLSEHPVLQGRDVQTSTEILSDSVAVRLYLSSQGAAIDAGLRAARKGAHVPFARCVVAGLSRLPSHRGATIFTASPSRDEWKLLSRRSLLTEWGFLNALTAPSAQLTGDVDVLIWAMTARRTKLLEPGGEEHVDNRVLFMPGTSFKILDIVEPSERGRGQVLIRELSASEIDSEGRVEKDRVSFDELATTSLRRCAERWAEEQPTTSVGAKAVARFGALPGLV